MQAVKPLLVRAGNVYKRPDGGKGCWVIRFPDQAGGRKRLRSIYVGDESLARQARTLLRDWRAETMSDTDRRRQTVLGILASNAVITNRSRRSRTRLKVAVLKELDDPKRIIGLAFGYLPTVKPCSKPGRPPEARLW